MRLVASYSCCDCIQWVILLGPNQLEQHYTSSDYFIHSRLEEIKLGDWGSLPIQSPHVQQVSVQPVDIAIGLVGYITTD